MPDWDWDRLAVLGAVIVLTFIVSELVDRSLARRKLDPGAITRYRILRRSVRAGIVFVGLFSALLVIPQVRAVAGGILASSAIIGIVFGFAARSTIANVIAGLMIATTQPLRIGDVIETGGERGVVEEITLNYTFIRLSDGARLVIPNEKLASDTIKNSSIRRHETFAEISVQVPIELELEKVVAALKETLADERELEIYVSELAEKATICVRAIASDAASAEALENELRLRVHARLRSDGAFT
ncbi:MAG TPA: mechanosensitive ion channel family protein [Gaiellaceae bacterium]|jgi:small-conductance mechanosensitive channel